MLEKLNAVLALFTPDRRELTAIEAADLLGWPKSTVYRLLGSIESAGFLDRDEATGRYRLGIELARLGELARQSTSLQRLVQPVLRQLSAETGETATLMVLRGNEGITVDVVESFQPLMLPGLIGGHMPLHATAGGKALLAWRPVDEVLAMLVTPLERYTPATTTNVRALLEELEIARKRGYTTVHGEFAQEVVGVGAPVRNHRSEIEAALTIGCPRSRATPAKIAAMGRSVVAGASGLSRALGYRETADDGRASPDRPRPRPSRASRGARP